MANEMRIDMDIVKIRSMLRSPTGPVGRKLIERGKAIEVRAKQLAAHHGTMANGIVSFVTPTLLGTEVIVMSTHPASIFVLKGTKPHRITSHGAWPLRNAKTGQVFGHSVWHPGYKGDDFMKKAMEEAGRI